MTAIREFTILVCVASLATMAMPATAYSEEETPLGLIWAEAHWAGASPWGEHGSEAGIGAGKLVVNGAALAHCTMDGNDVPGYCQTDTHKTFGCGTQAEAWTWIAGTPYVVKDFKRRDC